MKKYISIFLTALTVICCFTSYTALANDETDDNIIISEEEFNALEHIDATYIEARTTGLITDKKLGIAKSGNNLIISGYTKCLSSVEKCGFKTVTIQRKKSSETSWSTYKTYSSLYADSNTYTLGKSVTVPSGYQYRVTATHYAKKSLLSTQSIDATTGSLSF